MQPLLEATNFSLGKDFFLAYSPEREDPGNDVHTTATVAKVIGADDPSSLQVARVCTTRSSCKPFPWPPPQRQRL